MLPSAMIEPEPEACPWCLRPATRFCDTTLRDAGNDEAADERTCSAPMCDDCATTTRAMVCTLNDNCRRAEVDFCPACATAHTAAPRTLAREQWRQYVRQHANSQRASQR